MPSLATGQQPQILALNGVTLLIMSFSKADGALVAVHAAVVEHSPCRTAPGRDCEGCPRKPHNCGGRGSQRRLPKSPRLRGSGEMPTSDGALHVETGQRLLETEPGLAPEARGLKTRESRISQARTPKEQSQTKKHKRNPSLLERNSNRGFNVIKIFGVQKNLKKGGGNTERIQKKF